MMDLDALRSAGQNIQMPGTMKARLTTKVSVPPRKKILRRALAAALAICLCLGVGTAAAAGTEPVYSILYARSRPHWPNNSSRSRRAVSPMASAWRWSPPG